jgi:hypothetical protein
VTLGQLGLSLSWGVLGQLGYLRSAGPGPRGAIGPLGGALGRLHFFVKLDQCSVTNMILLAF